MNFSFQLPIGDWSKDGHGDCNWFKVRSNKSVQDVRESYFEITERLGTGLDNQDDAPCAEYEDRKLSLAWLEKVDLSLDDLAEVDTPREGEDFVEIWSSETMASLFVAFMNKHDPSLTLELVKDPDDMFPFYGFDEKKRHIGFMGYGCTGNF